MSFRSTGVFVLLLALIFSCSASKLGWKAENENVVKNEKREVVDDFDPLNLEDLDEMLELSGWKKSECTDISEYYKSTEQRGFRYLTLLSCGSFTTRCIYR